MEVRMTDDSEQSEKTKAALLKLAEALVAVQGVAWEELGEIEASIACINDQLQRADRLAREVLLLLGDDYAEVRAMLEQTVDPDENDDAENEGNVASSEDGLEPAREMYLEGSLEEVLTVLRRMRFRRGPSTNSNG
jgi:hypothetical protein